MKDAAGFALSALAVAGGLIVVIFGFPLWWLLPLLLMGALGVSLVGR